MAKVRGPLMSMEASGNWAGQLQFRGNRYGGHVYRPPAPSTQNQAPPTEKQAAVRARYALARTAWNALSQVERDTWNTSAQLDPRPVTGWNLFLASRMLTGNIPLVMHWNDGLSKWNSNQRWS